MAFNGNKIVVSDMLNERKKPDVDDIIASLKDLDNNERAKLQSALFDLQNDLDLHEAIKEGLDDIKNGRVSSHEAVMKEIKEKYNQ